MKTDYEVLSDARVPVKMWTRGVPVEDSAKQQLLNLANMPFVVSHVAAMPDVHWGMGSTVGSVYATQGAVIPASVGVDIGCGMMAVETSLVASDLPDNLHALRSAIEAAVPHGRTDDGGVNDRGAWGDARELPLDLWRGLEMIRGRHPKIERAATRAGNHLGTLGTGNHFIEICLDEKQHVWIMLHSGSRGIGNRIGSYFIELAKEDMRKWFINLPDQDLAYLAEGTDHYTEYRQAVYWAQEYAMENRRRMMEATMSAVASTVKPFESGSIAVNCHHNYVSEEKHFGKHVHVTRKGAVSARSGELGIIPGSMGAKSFIVSGKGNRESFCSCSHGAGRAMSRAEAKRRFTVADHIAATEGVECKKDDSVLDETPAAYKSIDAVMAAQDSLVDIVAVLKQVCCVKG